VPSSARHPVLLRQLPTKTTSTMVRLLAVAASHLLLFSSYPFVVLVEGRKTRLTWVNGIGHSLDHMEEGKEYISERFGGKDVTYCWNPTSMTHDEDVSGYIKDLTQAGTHKLGLITSEVEQLVDYLKEAVAAVGKDGVVVHVAHSQGALITALAAKRLTPTELNRIECIGFGGAVALRKTPSTPYRRCINYYAVNDPLLLVVPQAAQALRSGFSSTIISTAPTATANNGKDVAVADDENEFCFLAPRCGDPILDHSLFSPTYGQALEWEGARFQRLYVSPVVRVARQVAVLSVIVSEAASEQLNTALKAILRPIVLWCVLVWLWTRSIFLMVKDTIEQRLIQPMAVVMTSRIRRRGSEDMATTASAPESSGEGLETTTTISDDAFTADETSTK